MKWIQTLNDQIINLDNFDSFWIEEIPNGEFHVFGCDKDKNDWRIAEFNSLETAREYFNSKIWDEFSGIKELIKEIRGDEERMDSLNEVLLNVQKNSGN